MSKQPMDRDQLRRVVRQQAESLLKAGVEWIAMAPPLPEATAEIPASPEAVDASKAGSALVGSVQPIGNGADLFDAGPAAPSRSLEEKRLALQMLNEQQVVGCPKCAELVRNRKQTVFGVGNPSAELCFVGEAPGADEDIKGEPFVGAAGQLLTRIIAAMKMSRDEVYILNVLKCRPPGNRTPLPEEVAHCLPYLEEQLAIIQPKFLCALGAVAAQALLQTTLSIGKLRGRFHSYKGIALLCTYHPAFLLRSPDKKKEVWDDMKRLLAAMGRPVP